MAFQPSVQQAIMQAASQYGVDPNALMRIAQIESGGNPNAKNPNSSAGGLFQFVDGTASQYGLQNKFDPVQASDAAARLARDNASILSKTLGRDPSAGELYLAHQQGAGGAAKLLSNPNARAVDIVGNDAVRLNGGSPDMTAQDFANKWISKASIGSQVAAQPAAAPQASGTPAPPLPDAINVGAPPAQGNTAPPPGLLATLAEGNKPSQDQMSGLLQMVASMGQPEQPEPMQLQPMQRQTQVPSLAEYMQNFLSGRMA